MNTLVTLVALGLGNSPAPAPLHCPIPLAAKGDVKGGPSLAHTFELTHRGAAGTLTITKVEAGCGCLRRTLAAAVLQPGETTKLTLDINTLTQPDGPNRWQAVVSYTLDGAGTNQSGDVVLAVTATLSRDVTITPPQVALSTTGQAAQVLHVVDRRAKPLRVVKAACTSPHIAVELGGLEGGPGKAPLNPAGLTQEVRIRLSADAPPGQRDDALVLVTDDPAYPEFRVPVRISKRAPGAVTAVPEELAVRFAAGQDEVSALVQLRAPDGKPVRIAAAEGDSPTVAVKYSPDAGPVATVRVTVGGAAATRRGSCRVRVRLAEPAGQEVTIPVSWTGGTKK